MSKVVHLNANVGFTVASRHDSESDIDALLESFKLHNIRRFYDQIYWGDESTIGMDDDHDMSSGLPSDLPSALIPDQPNQPADPPVPPHPSLSLSFCFW